MKLTRIEIIDSPTFEKTTTDNLTCCSELGTQFSDANLFPIPSESQELFKTPVRSRPRPFYGVSNSPFCLYTSFSFPDTPETIFKGNGHDYDIFDDDYDFTGLHDIEFEKSHHHPRLNRVKKFVRKVLMSKTNSDLSFGSSDGYSEVGLSMNSWAESTGTLSGWTTISMPPSPLQSPMLRNQMWR
ncbi:hypothetical protein PILCRDRAFT_607229 [Piloderma croceum F 1598]|uniref:Uncharacterized protein n=1 Tax=Piloderma croceum (strain F 1598) TaxID=765440 RepID=A0A0C3AVG5_PILCF|nr:hypothetical protein PILCRDRAFT_607229 [Piloderma croceum F 1598]